MGNRKKRPGTGNAERDVWAAGQNSFLDLTDWEDEMLFGECSMRYDVWNIC